MAGGSAVPGMISPVTTGAAVTALQRAAGNIAVSQGIAMQRQGPVNAPGAVGAAAPTINDLRQAYQDAKEGERFLYDAAGNGAEEVLGNLAEQDEPSISQIILQALVMGALGFASGGISTALAGRLITNPSAVALSAAVQSGVDDLVKTAVPETVRLAMSEQGTSRSSFFAGVEQGFLEMRTRAVRGLNAQENRAITNAEADPSTLPAALETIRMHGTVANELGSAARDVGYRAALGSWLTAMARSELGTDSEHSGTDMADMPGHDGDPIDFYRRNVVNGVLHISFSIRSSRPVAVNSGMLVGVNEAVRQRIRGMRVKDLPIPVFAQGWFVDGFFDSILKGDNEVTMSMNEDRVVYVNYGSGAEEVMLGRGFARGEDSVTGVARNILQHDFGNLRFDQIPDVYN